MNITLTIQDITPRELAALMSAMEGLQTPAATPAPEPQPTPAPAEEHGQTVQARLMAEREARKEREEKEHAETLVVGENGIREPLGKALERLQEEKKVKGRAAKAVIGHHDDGDVRYWANASEAAARLGVSTVLIYKAIQECRKVRGWMLEYDEKWKGGAA